MKHFSIVLIIVFISLNFLSCSTRQLIQTDYSNVESVVLNDFHIDKEELLEKGSTQAKAAEEYSEVLDMRIYSTELIGHIQDRELVITLKHEYNILATGKEQISFSIKKVGYNSTELIVDYFENTNLFGFLPVTIGAGANKEKEILFILLEQLE